MNREGVPHRGGPWTRESVKDIVRRGRMYLGFLVEKRGRDERPGRHEPILSEAEYQQTMAAIAARRRVGNKPRPFCSYVLRGLPHCACGTRMRGEAHLQRGTERRYDRCPTLGCRARRCPADFVEETVLATIAQAVLPGLVIDAARTELRRCLETPEVAVTGRQRTRLLTRLEQLRKQHGWGDLSDADYQAQRDAVRAALATLPDDDRIRAFDAYRARILALPDAIDAAVLRKTAGVPPRGFEPLISTLKGWRPGPLDDGGQCGRSVPEPSTWTPFRVGSPVQQPENHRAGKRGR